MRQVRVNGIWRETSERYGTMSRREDSQDRGNGAAGSRGNRFGDGATVTCAHTATNTIGKSDVYVLTRDHKMACFDDVLSAR